MKKKNNKKETLKYMINKFEEFITFDKETQLKVILALKEELRKL